MTQTYCIVGLGQSNRGSLLLLRGITRSAERAQTALTSRKKWYSDDFSHAPLALNTVRSDLTSGSRPNRTNIMAPRMPMTCQRAQHRRRLERS